MPVTVFSVGVESTQGIGPFAGSSVTGLFPTNGTWSNTGNEVTWRSSAGQTVAANSAVNFTFQVSSGNIAFFETSITIFGSTSLGKFVNANFVTTEESGSPTTLPYVSLCYSTSPTANNKLSILL